MPYPSPAHVFRIVDLAPAGAGSSAIYPDPFSAHCLSMRAGIAAVSNVPSHGSLRALNSEIRACIQQLNTVVYLEVQLDHENWHFSALLELQNVLRVAKEDIRRQLEQQLGDFDKQFGLTSRSFFAGLYEQLRREMPATDPVTWPVDPPFCPIAIAQKPHGRWHSRHGISALAYSAVQLCTQRHYFFPRLRRAAAANELERLKTNMPATTALEQNLRAKLRHFQTTKAELEGAIHRLRDELASPVKIYESVPAYCEFASAARQCFHDMHYSCLHGTLVRIENSSKNTVHVEHNDRVPLMGLFKTFQEHHGVQFDCDQAGRDSWDSNATANAQNSGLDSSLDSKSNSELNDGKLLLSPQSLASHSVAKLASHSAA